MCLKIFGNLTKKILYSLLSGVLLFLLLGVSSKSYCKIIDSNDVANAINNIYMYKNNGNTLTKNDINITTCELIANNFNQHEGHWVIHYNNSSSLISFSYSAINRNAYLDNNILKWIGFNGQILLYSFNTKSFTRNSFSGMENYQVNTPLYTDCIIYSNSNQNAITYNAGNVYPSTFDIWAESLYITDYFSFNYNSNLSDIDIDEDFTNLKQIVYSDRNTNIADFGRTTHLQKVDLTYWTFNKQLDYFEPIKTVPTNNYTIQNEDLGQLFFTSSEFLANSIMQYHFYSNDNDNFPSFDVLFYCVDSNTVIVNGVLDITNTFNDSYYNQYIYDNNNFIGNTSVGQITNSSGDVTGYIDLQLINNSITDINNTLNDDSEVDNIISSNLSGDYDFFGEDIGYHVWENPFFTFLINILEDFYDALTERGNIQISLNSHGITNWVLNTDDFVTPNSSLKNVCRLCLIFFYIYFNYKFFYHLITLVQTFRIKTSIAVLGTDEFYDTDYM